MTAVTGSSHRREALAMSNLPRLRQIALAARDLDEVTGELQKTFGWGEPFHDPGVAEFGLENSVFAAGDTFIEVVSPVKPGTTAGRYLDKRGGDSGYMAIFQVDDIHAARRRVADAGIRVVWQIDLPDIAGTHLHPKDAPGAIVSLDWADPPDSWRWAGPAWTGKSPPNPPGSIKAMTVEVQDPAAAAARWSSALGVATTNENGVAVIDLREAGQILRFKPLESNSEGGITEVTLEGPAGVDSDICGVSFRTVESTLKGS
jgi:hypothetical protein